MKIGKYKSSIIWIVSLFIMYSASTFKDIYGETVGYIVYAISFLGLGLAYHVETKGKEPKYRVAQIVSRIFIGISYLCVFAVLVSPLFLEQIKLGGIRYYISLLTMIGIVSAMAGFPLGAVNYEYGKPKEIDNGKSILEKLNKQKEKDENEKNL